MHLYRLEREQCLAVPLDDAWDFFSHPGNLNAITPPDLHFEILVEPPREMHQGLIIQYRIQVLPGLRRHWVTELSTVAPKRVFVDEQRFGPFRFWHHQHLFEPVPGGIRMRDVVHYAMPAGPFGRLLHGLGIGRRLQRIFDYRRATLSAIFGEIPGL
jgi:ligand-binding SRPBCC domain-containing protein